MWRETKSKKQRQHERWRFIVFLCAVVVVMGVSSYCTVVVTDFLKQAAHYSTLDLRRVQLALYLYGLKAHKGESKYPATLQELVDKKLLSQEDLNRILAGYVLEYKQPAPGATEDTIVFRAQRKPPAIVYTVIGQNRIETAPR